MRRFLCCFQNHGARYSGFQNGIRLNFIIFYNGKRRSGSFFGFDPKINVFSMSFHLPGLSKEVGISSWWKSCCTQSLNLSSVNHFFVALLYRIVQKFFFWFPYLAKLFFPCISLSSFALLLISINSPSRGLHRSQSLFYIFRASVSWLDQVLSIYWCVQHHLPIHTM